jgi:AcrR family transcriptional regulator
MFTQVQPPCDEAQRSSVAGTFTEARREVVRAEIIATAQRVFTKSGVRATSMGQIAEAVGLGRPALYHYFPSKDDLVAATIRVAVERYESYGALPDDLRFSEAVKYFISRLLDNIAGIDGAPLRFFFTVLLEQFDDPHDQQTVRAIIDSYRRSVDDLLRLGTQRGEVRPDLDHQLAADHLTAQILGMQWIWLLNEGSVDLHAIAERTESDFLARVAIP